MTAVATRPASAAGPATALAIAIELVVLRAALDADEGRAYLLGHPIHVVCGMRARTGLPCPMCGATRAVALTLHGELPSALCLFPAAPIATLGLAVGAAALAAQFWIGQHHPGSRLAAIFEEHLKRGALLYTAFCAVLWLTDWTARVGVALAQR